MHKELQVEIISPEGFLFSGSCHLVTIPSVEGEIGFMADHESALAGLKEGKIAIFDAYQNILKEFSVTSGFAEMFGNKLLVLVDA
jgi:F-type H+-transporting ATPase subunit epsilon